MIINKLTTCKYDNKKLLLQLRKNKNSKSCDLAVRIDGKTYFVDGTTIHDHGDAHAEDGFCNAIRKASVTGTIEKNRFKATSFTLIKEK